MVAPISGHGMMHSLLDLDAGRGTTPWQTLCKDLRSRARLRSLLTGGRCGSRVKCGRFEDTCHTLGLQALRLLYLVGRVAVST